VNARSTAPTNTDGVAKIPVGMLEQSEVHPGLDSHVQPASILGLVPALGSPPNVWSDLPPVW